MCPEAEGGAQGGYGGGGYGGGGGGGGYGGGGGGFASKSCYVSTRFAKLSDLC